MRKRRAIIYDDDHILLRLYAQLFHSKGYEVLAYSQPIVCPIHADNADNAQRIGPCADIVIADYSMPFMNGLELLKAQSSHGCRLTMKNKALITGDAHEEIHREADELGCAFFEKSIDTDALETWIEKCEKRVDLVQPLAAPRREKRQFYSNAIPCMASLGDKMVEAAAVNGSRSGLCLRLATPLEEDQKIRVHTKLSIAAPAAAVRWVTRLPDGSYLAGLKFN